MATRRTFMKNICIAAAACTSSVGYSKTLPIQPSTDKCSKRGTSTTKFDSSVPIVPTTSGPVRGYIRNGVHTFKGIRYGAPTSGKNRFLPPHKPVPWKDVSNAVAYGYASLQRPGDDWRDPVSHFVMDFEHRGMSEDCLSLNVWTPSIDNARRPVLFYIHGGGFQTGSSFEMRSYDGENIVRRGDIVFVSVHHRLNVLGFLDLSSVGADEFESSANAGMLDLVEALNWVQENIANFGGDPSNVTICGQSGGGGKVNALLRMRRAKGLFHKAIIQSGSMRIFRDPKDSSRVGEGIVKRLGIEGRDLRELQQVPYDSLLDAASEVITQLNKEVGESSPMMGRFGWGPTADGLTITGDKAEDFSAGIPLLVGYTRNEIGTSAFDSSIDNLTADEAKAKLEKMYPRKTVAALVTDYQRQYPNCTAAFLYSVIASMIFADGAMTQVEERAARKDRAPVYCYRFDWCPDIYDGQLGAFHSLDIGFTFDNTERWDSATGGGERAQELASRMSQAWISFARSGNPNHRELPEWPTYSTSEKAVMIFDDLCQVLKGPDDNAHRILSQKLS